MLIDITKDAQFEKINFSYKKIVGIRSYKAVPKINHNNIKLAAELINNAKKPLIVWGQGVILGNAEKELIKFVEKSGIPAAWTILGASQFQQVIRLMLECLECMEIMLQIFLPMNVTSLLR